MHGSINVLKVNSAQHMFWYSVCFVKVHKNCKNLALTSGWFFFCVFSRHSCRCLWVFCSGRRICGCIAIANCVRVKRSLLLLLFLLQVGIKNILQPHKQNFMVAWTRNQAECNSDHIQLHEPWLCWNLLRPANHWLCPAVKNHKPKDSISCGQKISFYWSVVTKRRSRATQSKKAYEQVTEHGNIRSMRQRHHDADFGVPQVKFG